MVESIGDCIATALVLADVASVRVPDVISVAKVETSDCDCDVGIADVVVGNRMQHAGLPEHCENALRSIGCSATTRQNVVLVGGSTSGPLKLFSAKSSRLMSLRAPS